MALRVLQICLAGIDCAYGMLLVAGYGRSAWHMAGWQQPALALIVFSVLPASVLSVRLSTPAAIGQFACAFLGRQLLHNGPWPDLRLVAALSMTLAVAMVAVAVFRGVVEITREAYGETEHQDDRYIPEVNENEADLKVATAGGARNQLWF
ncbi:MAG TPA: hypothetical protein VHU89_06075 [Acidobacteriaceae bacterium]|jgi:hypothetical protein|nr:hypothetical protein [Acidobacteriaceae bacterium]